MAEGTSSDPLRRGRTLSQTKETRSSKAGERRGRGGARVSVSGDFSVPRMDVTKGRAKNVCRVKGKSEEVGVL